MTMLEDGLRPDDALEPVTTSYEALFDYLALTDEVVPADAIFCFGSRDPMVPVRAAALFAAGVAPVVVVTGGAHVPDAGSEAEVFATELTARGVPKDRLVVERSSLHTGDNVVHGMAELAAVLGGVRRIVSVAWPFAARRCVATFARHQPDLAIVSAPAFDIPGQRTPLTASSARWAVEQLDRIDSYRRLGWIDDADVPPEITAAGEQLRTALVASSGARDRARQASHAGRASLRSC